MDDLLELAARVERAEGADRELDAAVWWETHRHADTDPELVPMFEANPATALDKWCGMGWRHELQFPPRYTASLDAAMGLVPEGCVFMVQTDYGDLFRARVWDGYQSYQRDANNLPLALCAAALRARAAGEGGR